MTVCALPTAQNSNHAELECLEYIKGKSGIALTGDSRGRYGTRRGCCVYLRLPDAPLAETATPAPLTAYAADKLGCELHAAVASHLHRVPTTGFRLFNVYGPRQDPASPYSGVISIFIDRILGGRPIEIHGDGEQVRDFVFVRDAVRFLITGMETAGTRARSSVRA